MHKTWVVQKPLVSCMDIPYWDSYYFALKDDSPVVSGFQSLQQVTERQQQVSGWMGVLSETQVGKGAGKDQSAMFHGSEVLYILASMPFFG